MFIHPLIKSSESWLYKSHPAFSSKESHHVYYFILRRRTMQIALHNQRCCVQSCCSTSWASNSPDSSHPFHPGSQHRLHGVIFMRHRDAGVDECRQYARGRSRSRRAHLWHQITIISCSTGFHSALTRSTALVLLLMKALKWCFIAYPSTSLFVSGWHVCSLL